jgi:multidrug transporter EmrE-like cation transporter
MKKAYLSILLVIVAALLSATAQILFKFASGRLEFSFMGLITNVPLLIGLVVYGLVALIFILALKGGELSVLYPLLATAYVWVAIASPILFPEDSLNVFKVIGIAVIIFGVYSIGRGITHRVEVV